LRGTPDADHRLAVVLSTCRAVALAKADHPRSIFSFLIFNFSFSLSPIAADLSRDLAPLQLLTFNFQRSTLPPLRLCGKTLSPIIGSMSLSDRKKLAKNRVIRYILEA
jgi:hypothetical protein